MVAFARHGVVFEDEGILSACDIFYESGIDAFKCFFGKRFFSRED